MLEKTVTNQIMRYLRGLPCVFCWKQPGGMYGTAGLPDIICCVNGLFVAFEVKRPGGRMTKLQEVTQHKICNSGGLAFKVESLNEVVRIMGILEVIHNDNSMDLSGQESSDN